MPIFEFDDKISEDEIKRQQIALNEKVNRLKFIQEYTSLINECEFDGGDNWISEP